MKIRIPFVFQLDVHAYQREDDKAGESRALTCSVPVIVVVTNCLQIIFVNKVGKVGYQSRARWSQRTFCCWIRQASRKRNG